LRDPESTHGFLLHTPSIDCINARHALLNFLAMNMTKIINPFTADPVKALHFAILVLPPFLIVIFNF